MPFPIEVYDKAIAEIRATVVERDTRGRNETNDFYSQFPHGVSDLTFELYRRVQRILGAEKNGKLDVLYEDTLDLANYALFLMMLLKRQPAAPPVPPVAECTSYQPATDAACSRAGEYIAALASQSTKS